MIEHDEFPEATQESWKDYLKDFNERVFPIFEAAGFSKDAALICWFVNRVRNCLPEPDNENEDWKDG